MIDLSAIIHLVPEPWRTYLLAAIYAFLATQIAASGIVALLPAEAFSRWRMLRALSWYAHLAPRDAAGTFKAPFTTPLQPGAMEELERLRALTARVQNIAPELVAGIAPPSPSKVPPGPVDHSGERGGAEVRGVALLFAVALCLAGLGAVLTGCPSPRLPVVEGCTVGASRCREDRPQVCSSTGRWHDVGDLACAASAAVCVEGADGGVAHCASPIPANPFTSDGGSDAR